MRAKWSRLAQGRWWRRGWERTCRGCLRAEKLVSRDCNGEKSDAQYPSGQENVECPTCIAVAVPSASWSALGGKTKSVESDVSSSDAPVSLGIGALKMTTAWTECARSGPRAAQEAGWSVAT